MADFILADGDKVFSLNHIHQIDFSQIEKLKAIIHTAQGPFRVTGSRALHLAMVTNPSVLEGKRLKWAKRAWLIHNLVGHPGMQLLALMGRYKAAMSLHDKTIPNPKAK